MKGTHTLNDGTHQAKCNHIKNAWPIYVCEPYQLWEQFNIDAFEGFAPKPNQTVPKPSNFLKPNILSFHLWPTGDALIKNPEKKNS